MSAESTSVFHAEFLHGVGGGRKEHEYNPGLQVSGGTASEECWDFLMLLGNCSLECKFLQLLDFCGKSQDRESDHFFYVWRSTERDTSIAVNLFWKYHLLPRNVESGTARHTYIKTITLKMKERCTHIWRHPANALNIHCLYLHPQALGSHQAISRTPFQGSLQPSRYCKWHFKENRLVNASAKDGTCYNMHTMNGVRSKALEGNG